MERQVVEPNGDAGAEPRDGARPADLSEALAEAYASVRRRARSLRRRRIISSILAGGVLSGLLAIVGTYYVSSIPLPDALALPATTTVYYADGTTVMARLGAQNRTIVDPDSLPWHVGAAVVAAEDTGFWSQSSSLISRQYARAAATGTDTSGPLGEARLLIMSWKLDDQYHKQEILGFYLNTVYFGRGAYGIEAAARAYFGKSAASLTVPESVVLAGVIAAPGDGRFDPSVSPRSAQARFDSVVRSMVALGSIGPDVARVLRVPAVRPYDPLLFQSGMDRPTGLVVSHVLAELRQTPEFRNTPPGYLENGGFSIITTVEKEAQDLLEQTADETVAGSVMSGQPDNLQAAAAVVEPGSGRVLAYYGGHDGTGADYAGWYLTPDGLPAGYGAHPPGQTFTAFTLAAAIGKGISVRSRWTSPPARQFPDSGRTAQNPVRDTATAPCQPECALAEAAVAELGVPFFAVAERIGPGAIIDAARAAGIESMWVPQSASRPRERFELSSQGGAALTPRPFDTDVALGRYPVTVLDQANAMAALASGGRRADAHFVRRVAKDAETIYSERAPSDGAGALAEPVVADVTWVMSQNPAGRLPGGRPSAAQTASVRLRDSGYENAHAWIIGFTPSLAMAVWIGNEEIEFPLRDKLGGRVAGSGLPAEIYRAFMASAHERLHLPTGRFPDPQFTGDADAGDAR